MMARIVVMSVLVLAMCLMLLVHDVEGKKRGGGGKAAKKAAKRRMHTVVKDLENNVTALWTEVKQLSQPVHVHLHGDGHVMDPDPHHGSHDEDHHSYDHLAIDEHDKHGHEDHDKSDKKDDDKDKDKHSHGHKHDHKGHSHDDDEKKMSHHWPEDKMKWMKMMKLKKMKHGHDHHGEGEEDDWGLWEEWKKDHDKHMGTHVHIHLHTGMEQEEGMESKHHSLPREFRYARCDVVPNSALPPMERESVKGAIYFRQMPMKPLEAKVLLEGFAIKQPWAREDQKQLRGLHGHEFGDLSNGCNSLGGHINPFGVSHGGPEAEHRHLGDFGNIEVRHDGTATRSFTDDVATLFGSDSLLGRSMVIHTAADDLGGGDSEASKKYGNAGGRSACCIIAASPKPAGVWTGDSDGDDLARPAQPKHMHKHN